MGIAVIHTSTRHTMIAGLAALLAACTGAGIDRGDAVPVRATLAIRPVADGDPYVETLAATAQDTLVEPRAEAGPEPAVEVTPHTLYSARLPPVDTWQLHAGSKETLADLVRRAGPVPPGLAVAYEEISGAVVPASSRWSVLALRSDQGMVLGPDTRVKMAWASQTEQHSGLDGVYLLLDRDDARAFEQLTIEHDGRRLAIVDGDDVLLAPTVNEPIGGGQLLITPGGPVSAAAIFERLAGAPPPPAPEP